MYHFEQEVEAEHVINWLFSVTVLPNSGARAAGHGSGGCSSVEARINGTEEIRP